MSTLKMSPSDEEDRTKARFKQLADQLTFPGFTYVIALEEGYKPLRKVFERVERSEIYRAN